MESAEWIRVRVVSSRGDKGEHWNEKVWTMFLTSSKRLTAAVRSLRSLRGMRSGQIHLFFSFGIDRFFMDSSLHDSRSGLTGDSWMRGISQCRESDWWFQVQLSTLRVKKKKKVQSCRFG